MQINKEQFLALSLSMSVSLTMACKKKDPKNAMDGEEATQNQEMTPTEEGMLPEDEGYNEADDYYRYGPCTEAVIDGVPRQFSFDVYNECSIECGVGEQNVCYDVWDECTDWNPTSECIQFETMLITKEAPDGCVRFVPEDPTFECYEWK